MATLTVTASEDFRDGDPPLPADITSLVFDTPSTTFIAVVPIFASNQFGPGLISPNLAITGDNGSLDNLTIFLSGAGAFSAAGFTFSNFTLDVVTIRGTNGADTIIGSSVADQIDASNGADNISAGGGDDKIIIDSNDVLAGETIDGGTHNSFDAILTQGNGSIDLSPATISNIERLIMPLASPDVTVIVDGNQIGIGRIATVDSGHPEGHQNLVVNGQTVDLSGVTFANWEATNSITINGIGSSPTLVGSSEADTINGVAGTSNDITGADGADTLIGGGQADTFRYHGPSEIAAGETLDGNGGINTIVLDQLQVGESAYDFTLASMVEIDRLEFAASGPCFATLSDAEIGGGVINTVVAGSGRTILFVIGADINLSTVTFVNWGSNAGILLDGTTGADSIIGSAEEDIFNSSAGADIQRGGGGNDDFRLNSASHLAAGEIIDGGAGSNRLVLFNSGICDFTEITITSIQLLDFAAASNSGPNGSFVSATVVLASSQIGAGAISHIDGFNIAPDTLIVEGGSVDLSAVIFTEWTAGQDTITLRGTAASDLLIGSNQNDTFSASAGGDTMRGGAGNDTYFVEDPGDQTIENANQGTDTVIAILNHTLAANVEVLALSGAAIIGTGNSSDNLLVGNGLDNFLDGAGGADIMRGVTGNDTYIVDNAGDQTIENANEGTDTVIARINHTLGANLEVLALSGAAVSGTGNAADNVIVGNSLDNFLDGAGGADVMRGVAGNDTYTVDNVGDQVIENANQGTDTVIARVNHTLGTNFEVLALSGAAIIGTGNSANNFLVGNGLDNVLDGAGGADVMRGVAGNDTYTIDNIGDQVIENANEGTDTVIARVNHTLGANFEILALSGAAVSGTGNAVDNFIVGNSLDNVLDGAGGADTMVGQAGNDEYTVDNAGDQVIENVGEGTDTVNSSVSFALGANIENLRLIGGSAINGTGNGLVNNLFGNNQANTLDGGGGADVMRGGAGSDTYIVDDVGDQVVENPNEGTDTVIARVNHTLGANFEVLALSGAAIVGTGNGANNFLIGNGLDNVLDGAGGADIMRGVTGNDTYTVEDAGDQVIENASEGTDTVISFLNLTLAANVEILRLEGFAERGAGNGLDNILFGNAQANVLDGAGGADTLVGQAGDDEYTVDNAGDQVIERANEGTDTVISSVNSVLGANVENLQLVGGAISANGNEGNNAIAGNALDNIINGGSGSDTLTGGGGRDTFVFRLDAGGQNTVTDFDLTANNDFLAFGTTLYANSADVLAHSAQIGADVVITHDSAHVVTLQNTALATLTAHSGDFQFI